MTKIYTRDKDGNKILVEYSQKLVEEPEEKPDITIDDYKTFKMCIQESQKQKEYVSGDPRYERALSDLVRNNHGLYEEYSRKLHEEYRNSR